MTTRAPEKKNPYRLDRTVEPLVYTIELEPDLAKFTFRGSESVTFRAARPFSKITLHAAEIKVTKAFLAGGKFKTPLAARKISYHEKFETVTLDFGRKVAPKEAERLVLEFTGHLNDKMHGFYRTSYEIKGKKHWGAATQFEATDARRAFPCWDEPDAKARFKISLVVPEKLTALSNMPVEKQSRLPGGRKKVAYEVTPVMSTYLVCFVVADLESLQGRDKNGVLIRIYVTPGKKEQGKFALEVARHALEYFSKWFGIPYALPKCDMVALPDFASGAMENWGLVTYRETALLVDPKNSSAAARQRVAEVIDHELAHQWFGNLVTMRWWTDLWLNEGFASYMGPKAVDDQFPEWRIWDQFVVADTLHALYDDALQNTHPIEIPVQDPAEIREIFDAITYSKGSSVNRMLEHYLGEKVFQKGLQVYLKKFKFKNATTRDLWAVLEKVSGKPVRAIMASYTDQPGFPLLKIEPDNRAASRFRVRQERFIFDGTPDRARQLWNIPLVIRGAASKKSWVGILKSKETAVDLGEDRHAWVKVNPSQSGFYRVAYPAEMMEPLIEALRERSLPDPVIDALGILSDALALARAGHIETSRVFEIARALGNEREMNLWSLIAGAIGAVSELLDGESLKARVAEFARALLSPCLEDLGWERRPADSHSDILLRSMMIFQAGHYGDEGVIDEARARFRKFAAGGELDANLRGAVYSLVAENGGQEEFSALVKIYRASSLQEEKVRVLRALARFRNPSVVAEVLKFALSKDVRNQDCYAVLASFGGNDHGRHQAWAFIKAHMKDLMARYTGGSISLLGRILEGASTGFKTPEELRDVETFFKKYPVNGIERTMKQSLEIIRSNIRWQPRAQAEILAWFHS